ncbi:MAG: Mov34/MPN/PAD-1 family protein, partial [Actinomycetes bacterium]
MTRRALPRWRRGVQARIYDHVYSSPGGEVGGVLVGEIPKSGPMRITAAIPALRAEGERASVTFTHDAWSDVHAIMERKHKGKRIVGWYHSHPGFGIFLSEHDLFIQRNFFSDPAQVAYVVDPHASTEGLFGWIDGDIKQVMSATTPRDPVTRPLPGKTGAEHQRSTRRGALIAGIIAAIIAAALVWLVAFNGGDESVPAPTPTPSTTQQD